MNFGLSDIVNTVVNPIAGQAKMALDSVTGAMKNTDGEADKAAESEYQQKMAGLATNELGQYQDIVSGKKSGITPEQQTAIDKKISVEQAKMRQDFSYMGMADSSARLSEKSSIQQDRIAMQEATTQATEKEHWDAFVKASGISEGSSRVLTAMNETDRKQAMEIYSATMGAMGAAAGAASGSKSTVLEYSDGTSYVPDNVSKADYYGFGDQPGNQ